MKKISHTLCVISLSVFISSLYGMEEPNQIDNIKKDAGESQIFNPHTSELKQHNTLMHDTVNEQHSDMEVSDLIGLVEQYNELDRVNNEKCTLLHTASYLGLIKAVEVLLEFGADINEQDNDGYTPLHRATFKGNIDIVDLLLRKGADTDLKNNCGATSLHIASSFKYTEIITLLCKHNANVNAVDTMSGYTPLIISASKGNVNAIDILFLVGADVNHAGYNGETPLLIAALHGYTEIVELLCKFQAQANQADKTGITPLHISSYLGHIEIVKLLLNAGANTHQKSTLGKTALDMAHIKGHEDIAKLFQKQVDHNSDISIKSKSKRYKK
ncbi:MAG TPA: ankyrin repeat domain-containing protein [Candidatus Babeliales bacterium]|nr:ankyrin repeat domain-containing protein [Candidatus Babeliales bacterium]